MEARTDLKKRLPPETHPPAGTFLQQDPYPCPSPRVRDRHIQHRAAGAMTPNASIHHGVLRMRPRKRPGVSASAASPLHSRRCSQGASEALRLWWGRHPLPAVSEGPVRHRRAARGSAAMMCAVTMGTSGEREGSRRGSACCRRQPPLANYPRVLIWQADSGFNYHP